MIREDKSDSPGWESSCLQWLPILRLPFLLCFQYGRSSENSRCRKKTTTGIVNLFRGHGFYFNRFRINPFFLLNTSGIFNSSLLTFSQAIHTSDTTAIINFMGFGINTGCLTITCAQSAAITFGSIDHRLEDGVS